MRRAGSIPDGPVSKDSSVDISVRKIDNGYVKRVSTYGPEGYKSSETFSRGNPGLGMGERDSQVRQVGKEGLKEAMKECKR